MKNSSPSRQHIPGRGDGGAGPSSVPGDRSEPLPLRFVALAAELLHVLLQTPVPQIVHCRIPVADLNSRYGTPCSHKSWSYRLHCLSGACRGMEQLPHRSLSPESSDPQRATIGVDERRAQAIPRSRGWGRHSSRGFTGQIGNLRYGSRIAHTSHRFVLLVLSSINLGVGTRWGSGPHMPTGSLMGYRLRFPHAAQV
jgi:hypothetical protein